jgi:HAD superfamily hydrolase (TIGR01509 family)
VTPQSLIAARTAPLRLVIFDCDGVLVDSEPVANRVVAADLTAIGWPMTPAEADRLFLGMTLTDMQPVIEARLGRALPQAWKPALMARMVEALSLEATAIPGAVDALHAVSALGLAWRVASNSSHQEMAAKFTRIGIAELVRGRVHSHRDVGRGKPAPDLFLATAAAEPAHPAECLVIEDSIPGARAAAAAGMQCLAYVSHGDGTAMRAEGAVPFGSMRDLPGLLARAWRMAA